jgi:iron-sulfur cluster insertion protein
MAEMNIHCDPDGRREDHRAAGGRKQDRRGLRVFVQGGGCSGFQYGLMIDEGEGRRTTDAVIETNGVKLLVDPISARYLKGAEVDFVDNVTAGLHDQEPERQVDVRLRSSFSV